MEEHRNFNCFISIYMPIPASALYRRYRHLGLPEFSTLDEFAQIGVGADRKNSLAFGLKWLDITEARKRHLRRSVRLSAYYMQTLSVRRHYTGIIRLVNELFYRTCRYRFENLKTGLMIDAFFYNLAVRAYGILVRKGFLKVPEGFDV